MSTTTIRLPDNLKARVQKAAHARGLSAHALILEAIAEKTNSSELRTDFYDTADARFAKIAETGKTIKWEDVRAYLKSRAAGKSTSRPSPRTFER